jgi:hypothetical protein
LKATLTLVDEGVDLERYNTPFYSTGFETGGSPSELGGSSSGSFGYHEDTSIEGRLIGQLTSGGGYVESTTGWNKTDVIASCYIKSDIVPSGADASIMGFQNGADATIAGVQISDTTGIIAAFWPLNGGVDGTFTDSVWVADQWNLVEFRLKVSSTNGAVSLKINGVTIIDERDINTSGNNIDRGSIGMGGGAVGSFDLWTLTVPI